MSNSDRVPVDDLRELIEEWRDVNHFPQREVGFDMAANDLEELIEDGAE